MTIKEAINELAFLCAEISSLDCSEECRHRYRESIGKSIEALEWCERMEDDRK